MTRWFHPVRDRARSTGLVSELARLCRLRRELEDSRMTILGTDFAVILLCSSRAEAREIGCARSKRLERDLASHLIRELPRRRPAVRAGTRLIASKRPARIAPGSWRHCGVLAEHGVNIVELESQNQPGPAAHRITA